MSDIYAGTPRRFRFLTYKFTYVAGVLTAALYDAPVTKLTFRNVTLGTEDTLTYGGTDPRDSQLTRAGVGTYEAWFTYTTAGNWNHSAEWIETISGVSVTIKGDIQRRIVRNDPLAWVDVPAP
jgi:hypothetical protein